MQRLVRGDTCAHAGCTCAHTPLRVLNAYRGYCFMSPVPPAGIQSEGVELRVTLSQFRKNLDSLLYKWVVWGLFGVVVVFWVQCLGLKVCGCVSV